MNGGGECCACAPQQTGASTDVDVAHIDAHVWDAEKPMTPVFYQVSIEEGGDRMCLGCTGGPGVQGERKRIVDAREKGKMLLRERS